MQSVRGSHDTFDKFRKTKNWIGPPGCTLNTAKFLLPPTQTHNLSECLGDLEKFLHGTQLPALIHIALCHCQFDAII